MSDYKAYDDLIQQIVDSQTAVNDKYVQMGDAASTLCDVNQVVNQIPQATVVRNNGGEVIGYDYKYTSPQQPDTSIIGIDSNTDSGNYGSAYGGGGHTSGGGAGRFRSSQYAGTIVDSETSTDKTNSSGFVSTLISLPWAAASALSKFGRNVGSVAADAVETLGHAVNSAYNNLATKAVDGTANAIRVLFGVDPQTGDTSMYMEEDVLGAYAIKAKEGNFFSDDYEPDYALPILPTGVTTYYSWSGRLASVSMPKLYRMAAGYNRYLYNVIISGSAVNLCIRRKVSASSELEKFSKMVSVSETPFSVITQRYAANASWEPTGSPEIAEYGSTSYVLPNGKTVYYMADYISGTIDGVYPTKNGDNALIPPPSELSVCIYTKSTATTDSYIWQDVCKIWYMGEKHQGASPIDGITPQSDATVPVDAITGADPHVVAQNLYNQYPDVMGEPILINVMDDSCNQVTKKYYKVPITYSPTNLNLNVPITTYTQTNPTFNPDTLPDLPDYNDIDINNYIDQIIKILTDTGGGVDVTTEPLPDDPDTKSSDITGGELPTEPPNTGTGETPESTLPDTTATAFWHVYNPSVSQLTAFCNWLWGGTIVDQFKKIFNNPMDAIIGVHAVYGTPHVGSAESIVCGNIASSVSALVVTSQYTSVDCGSIWLTEYFGNVFDYPPYTEVSLFLPFIGIVPLDVSDVMRANISVKYNIDVFTGACNAQVVVTRDSAGGVLYQYGGSCAVEYPVSGSSYNNIISSMIGVGTSVASLVFAPEMSPILAASHGLSSAASAFKNTISRSGSFGANVGAMGAKKPYLIITRPITEMAVNFEQYDGLPANKQTALGSCSGYTKCKEVHLNIPGAFKSELDEIERLLRIGVIL